MAPENIMSQSLTSLPHTANNSNNGSLYNPVMTNSFSGIFPKASASSEAPSFSSNLTLTPLHSESRTSGSEAKSRSPAPPRITPLRSGGGAGECPPPLPPKSAGGEQKPPPRPASKVKYFFFNSTEKYLLGLIRLFHIHMKEYASELPRILVADLS